MSFSSKENIDNLAGALRLAANAAFGDPDTADTWLTTKLATLNGQTPIEVAIESDKGYVEIARKLLHIQNSFIMS